MWDFLFYCLLIVLLCAASIGGVVLFRRGIDFSGVIDPLVKPRANRRIQIVERKSVDNRRKLVLIQRDNVEHLILTGGPVDVVIETGIGEDSFVRKESSKLSNVVEAPAFSRVAKVLGRSAGET